MTDQPGRIAGLALREGPRQPMRQLSAAEAIAGAGLAGHGRLNPDRGLTILSREQWEETMRELGADLPWHARRANVLVEGIDLAATIGGRLRLGEVLIDVLGETDPCPVMDRAYLGLRTALLPACRGGVHGRVVQGGWLRTGDAVSAEQASRSAGMEAS